MNSKIAQASMLATLIIILASAIVIGIVVYNIASEGKTKVDIEACRTSVLFAATAKKFTENEVNLPIQCPSESLVFEKETADEANKQIAQSIVNCAYKFGEGELDFANAGFSIVSQNVCIMCTTFEFQGQAKENYKEYLDSGENFYRWAGKNKIPGKQITYEEYFDTLNTQTSAKEKNLFVHILPILNLDKQHAVYFLRPSKSKQGFLVENLKKIPGISDARNYVQTNVVGPSLRWSGLDYTTLEEAGAYPQAEIFMVNIDTINENQCDFLIY